MTNKSSPNQKMLFWWGWILIAWSIYRAVFRTDLPIWFDELIAKTFIFIVPVVFYIRQRDQEKITSGLWFTTKNFLQDVGIGLLVGGSFFLSGVGSMGWAGIAKANIGLVLAVALATSIAEEVLSRGFVLKRLYKESGSVFSASFFASILYFFLRVPILFTNEKIVGTTLLNVMFTDIVFSMVVSVIFLYRRSLTAPIIIHFFYILSAYLYLGFS